MAPKHSHPPGPVMDLANMHSLGVRGLAVYCLNPRCLHRARIDVDGYPDDLPVPWFGPRARNAGSLVLTPGRTGWRSRICRHGSGTKRTDQLPSQPCPAAGFVVE